MDTKETVTENRKFPLMPNYAGPTEGMFGCVHHDRLCEWSDNIGERCKYVETEKSESELPIRRSHMMYLDPVECPAAYAIKALDDKYRADFKALNDKYEADCKALEAEVLRYLRAQIPDCRWDEKTNQLRFE